MAKVPPRNPKYTPADLWPPGSQYVDFPPAAFHPVYLGNFLCQNFWDLGPRVQEYFASKGLLARMVFNRNADRDPFRAYQDKTKLYDCLVYFTRAEDAQDAIKYLHRDRYYGHRLNIFPGRTAVQMDATLSVGYDLVEAKLTAWPASKIEDDIEHKRRVIVKGSHRLTEGLLAMEYINPDQLAKALTLTHLKTFPLTGEPIRYQRFLESEVIKEIRLEIRKTMFMNQRPEPYILDALFLGLVPDIPSITEMDMDAPIEVEKEKKVSVGPPPAKKSKQNKFHQKWRKQKRKKKNAICQVQLPWQVALKEGQNP